MVKRKFRDSNAWILIKYAKRSVATSIALLSLLQGFSFADEVTIGAPYQNNLQQDAFLDNPDDPALAEKLKRFQYQISCTHLIGTSENIYKSISPLVRSSDKPMGLKGASFGVIYFVSGQTRQYIYGTLADSRGRSNGKKIYVPSEDWDCQLFNAQKN